MAIWLVNRVSFLWKSCLAIENKLNESSLTEIYFRKASTKWKKGCQIKVTSHSKRRIDQLFNELTSYDSEISFIRLINRFFFSLIQLPYWKGSYLSYITFYHSLIETYSEIKWCSLIEGYVKVSPKRRARTSLIDYLFEYESTTNKRAHCCIRKHGNQGSQ